jgi:hypothetical protein
MVLFQLNQKEVFATKLICRYDADYLTLWPTHRRCVVSNHNFSSFARNERFSFTGSMKEKNEATVVYFYSSPSIDFIPLEILTEFPNLNGIRIYGSNIPTLEEGFFTKDFKDILYLSLGTNKINQIEENALINLQELKWVDLERNQIESIKTNIFIKSLKLKYIFLRYNNIKMINPQLFLNLNDLVEVWLDNNECTDSDFGGSDESLTLMNDNLKNCHTNCLNDDECAADMIVTTTTKTTTTTTIAPTKKTELETPEEEFVSHSKFEEFENMTLSKFAALNGFCRIEINKTSEDLEFLKEHCEDLDTKLQQRDEKWSALKENMMIISENFNTVSQCSKKVDDLQDKFDTALKTTKCQLEKETCELRNSDLLKRNSVLEEKNAALEKRLANDRDELEKKYKMELSKKLADKINSLEIKFQDELKEQYVNIMREVRSMPLKH